MAPLEPIPSLKPVLRAYLLAYLSSTSPKVVGLLIALIQKDGQISKASHDLLRTMRKALELNRFPAFCAFIMGGSVTLQVPFRLLLNQLDKRANAKTTRSRTEEGLLLARFLASLVSALAGFSLINRGFAKQSIQDRVAAVGVVKKQSVDSDSHRLQIQQSRSGVDLQKVASKDRRKTRIPPGLPPLPAEVLTEPPPIVAKGVPLAGKTIDLTLFAFVRAADIVVSSLWNSRPNENRVRRFISNNGITILFAMSSATIMNAFFYHPSQLPYTYVRWIDRMAELDERLLHVLQQARYGNFVYGKETGIAPLVGSLCKDLGLPEVWGDPAKTIPLPCEVVHQGCGKSCELHALWRFRRGFIRALGVYAPLQAFILFRALQNPKIAKVDAVIKVALDAARSSAFLGGFVALFYYGVCLSRTRIGPKIFSPKTVTPQMYDGGLCVAGGCLMCGGSILIEAPWRRAELMLFVLPRALGAWFPRRYPTDYRWREQLIFAVSTAVILTTAQSRPEKIRGVFGKIVRQVVAP
ncbi:hypothetical protein FKW77_004819 [Venturia effusa]|uniref:Transmembrane protein 135 N-terminal domain-containing protein n=1 Tax=Venturia effusa TaxID=50376 RepID=A0A517LDN3_9PEZI|nr:hypothetical protein FKW77_004819 [Venturia effusa]